VNPCLSVISEYSSWPAKSESVKIFKISQPVPEIVAKTCTFFNNSSYSVEAFFDFEQMFFIPLKIKFDPYEIEMFCFFCS
jgi:hypothetical protein